MDNQVSSRGQITSTPMPAVGKPKDWFKILQIVIGFLVVLGLFGNIYLLLRKEKQKPISKIIPTPTPTSLPRVRQPADLRSTPTHDPTANWKTYINTKYQYLVKYPLTFSVTEQPSEYVRLSLGQNQPNQPSSQTYLSIQLKDNPQKLSLQEWEKANVNVANHAPFPKGVTYLENNGTIFQITPVIMDREDTDGSIGETFDQILSTFKFLE